MYLVKKVRACIKSMFSLMGLDLVRVANSPRQTLCGLRALPIRTVIDVGANRGQFEWVARRVFPNAKTLVFEPLPGSYKELELWGGSQSGRVETFKLPLGEAKDTEIQLLRNRIPTVGSQKSLILSEKKKLSSNIRLEKNRLSLLKNTENTLSKQIEDVGEN